MRITVRAQTRLRAVTLSRVRAVSPAREQDEGPRKRVIRGPPDSNRECPCSGAGASALDLTPDERLHLGPTEVVGHLHRG
jgi:hypothetical protein